MSDFKFGEGISGLINFYSKSSIPVVITDTQFDVIGKNSASRDTSLPYLGSSLVKAEVLDLKNACFLEQLKKGETISFSGDNCAPMSNIIVTFIPVFNTLDENIEGRFLQNIVIMLSHSTKNNYQPGNYNEMVINSFDFQVREPLSEILTCINAIKNRCLSDDHSYFNPYLNKMLQNSYIILRNYTLISEYTKLKNGLRTLNLERVCALDYLDLLFTSVKVVGETRDQKINYRLDISKKTYIDIDKDLFVMAILQFISNSFKHRDKNVCVNINAYLSEDRLFIRIEDNARGISPTVLPNIFIPYYSYHPFYPVGGTGLGLCLARKIIEKHEGTIAISSELEIGTVVAFSLETKFPEELEESVLNSFPSDFILNKFSPIYVHLSDAQNPPILM